MLKSKKQKTIGIVVSTIIMILIIIYLGPMDGFTHGFFLREINRNQISQEDWLDVIDLQDNYEITFTPQKKHFAGFAIFLKNQPGNSGILRLEIEDANAKLLDHISVDVSKVYDNTWYMVHVNTKLKQGEEYKLRFIADNCTTVPCLQAVDRAYLPAETISGNILITYAYADPTFTFQNKVIISMFIAAIWIFICGILIEGKVKIWLSAFAPMIFMTSVLTWNYMYNSMNNTQQGMFLGFQINSETLVSGTIYAEREGVYFRDDSEKGYGLGRYYDLKGPFVGYGAVYISDDVWLNGYSRSEAAIVVSSNTYSQEVAVPGNSIRFKNGEQYEIRNSSDDGTIIVVYLNSEKILSSAKNGSLDDVEFYDSNGTRLEKSGITAYKSQYGLQGKVFKRMARFMDEDQAIANLNLICCVATAFVFSIIVFFLYKKYNALLGGCFFVTFWLSPWIINYARNLYWVEFTWFIPMAIGLFCALKIDNKKCRIASYILTFVAIMGKCLCGYEYISTVMLGLISFLLVDLISAWIKRDRQRVILLFRTTFIIGILALEGFMAAICIHASLRGGVQEAY